jgi:hypothetical protein
VATVPFIQGTSDRIIRLLVKFNIRIVHILAKENVHLLRPVKDTLGLKVPGIYCITYECGRVYKEQMDCSIEMRTCTTHTSIQRCLSTACGPDTADGTSSCGPFNISVHNLQVGLFLGYSSFG